MFHARELVATIPTRIKEFRVQHGLGEQTLSARTGIPEERLRSIESGVSLPSLDDLQRIAVGLGVQLQDLIAPRR
ncbi:MAG TPA: helix-turn-helix transcriptional regulator [Myxococcota bacterium]|nr:helix-turn-helix transcriptional regulator [Myxococcota bacterium]HRY93280.1 helix-turn-helix transcriptional regulator [Myxococcota bacterium]HSA23522.1 helix-turn-helix transcriptional regulator [Myxococcota bacterium]